MSCSFGPIFKKGHLISRTPSHRLFVPATGVPLHACPDQMCTLLRNWEQYSNTIAFSIVNQVPVPRYGSTTILLLIRTCNKSQIYAYIHTIIFCIHYPNTSQVCYIPVVTIWTFLIHISSNSEVQVCFFET